MKKFNWKAFKASRICVNCKTEEESDIFLKLCEEKGILFPNVVKNNEIKIRFKLFKEETVYSVVKGKLCLEEKSFFEKTNLHIVEWENYIEKQNNNIEQIKQMPEDYKESQSKSTDELLKMIKEKLEEKKK